MPSIINSSTSAGLITTGSTDGSLALQTNGTTAVTIDTSGNVGIGTSSPVTLKSATTLQVLGNIKIGNANGAGLLSLGDTSSTGANAGVWRGAAGAYGSTGNYLNLGGYDGITFTTGNADIASQTERMRIDTSGNLLVGTTSANANFYVYNNPVSYAGLNTTAILSSSAAQSTGTGGLLAFEGKYTSGGSLANFAAIGGLKENSTDSNYAGYLGFYTRSNGSLASERMRIDSSGNLLVNTTSTNSNEKVRIKNGNDSRAIAFQSGSSAEAGYIYINSGGTTVNYSTSSDYRLKQNVAPMTGALDKISQLKPCTYDWKIGGSGQGFIAHELQAVVPDCVTGEKDAVDADGNPVYQGIDTSFLVATLTAAIKEQQAQISSQAAVIQTLQTQVAQLQSKVGV